MRKNNLRQWWQIRGAKGNAIGGYAAVLLGSSVLSACVTINIYFPAAAAEKAADKIIDEVWQLREGAKEKPAAPAATPQR